MVKNDLVFEAKCHLKLLLLSGAVSMRNLFKAYIKNQMWRIFAMFLN